MKDELGDRMKEFYENRTRFKLLRRTYTIIRIDGKNFSNYTKNLKRPFDDDLMDDMNETALYLCQNIMGVKMAFIQSDEISLVLTDFEKNKTESWFDGNIQKISSISASMATGKFNLLRILRKLENSPIFNYESIKKLKQAEFDSRVFNIPTKTEVINYFIFRQQDTTRNSIQSVAQSLFKNKKEKNKILKNKNSSQLQELIFQNGMNWNDLDAKYKRGRVIKKVETILDNDVVRNKWVIIEPPIFSQNKEFFDDIIPNN